jgi:8-oxo-dGTP pyrophosphatase MutT (NUDIX family)
LEKGETAAEGAARETYEEARASVKDLDPYFLFDLTFIAQIYLLFIGSLVDGTFSAGAESLEARLFLKEEIPWNDLAFPVIREGLELFVADSETGRFPFHMGAMRER